MKIKNRNLYASITLILIFVVGFTSDVVALNYSFSFTTNEDLVWKCDICDTNKMNTLFGENWSNSGLFENLGQGKRMKWQVNIKLILLLYQQLSICGYGKTKIIGAITIMLLSFLIVRMHQILIYQLLFHLYPSGYLFQLVFI